MSYGLMEFSVWINPSNRGWGIVSTEVVKNAADQRSFFRKQIQNGTKIFFNKYSYTLSLVKFQLIDSEMWL